MTLSVAEVHFLHPGQIFFGSGQGKVRTVLGSCVAMVLWHPRRLLGGMCHYVLPHRHGAAGPLDGRYGDEAVELLRLAALKEGSSLREYKVWLFGGGNMFPHVAATGAPLIGIQNIEVAEHLSRRLGLRIVQRDVGTSRYRNVLLDLQDGTVSCVRTDITTAISRN